MARRRSRAPSVLARRRSLRGRPAPRRGHRCGCGQRGRRARGGDGVVRRLGPERRPRADDPDLRRVRGHPAPARLRLRAARRGRRGGSDGRRRRPERRCGHARAARPPRGAHRRRRRRLRRSARAAAVSRAGARTSAVDRSGRAPAGRADSRARTADCGRAADPGGPRAAFTGATAPAGGEGRGAGAARSDRTCPGRDRGRLHRDDGRASSGLDLGAAAPARPGLERDRRAAGCAGLARKPDGALRRGRVRAECGPRASARVTRAACGGRAATGSRQCLGTRTPGGSLAGDPSSAGRGPHPPRDGAGGDGDRVGPA